MSAKYTLVYAQLLEWGCVASWRQHKCMHCTMIYSCTFTSAGSAMIARSTRPRVTPAKKHSMATTDSCRRKRSLVRQSTQRLKLSLNSKSLMMRISMHVSVYMCLCCILAMQCRHTTWSETCPARRHMPVQLVRSPRISTSTMYSPQGVRSAGQKI